MDFQLSLKNMVSDNKDLFWNVVESIDSFMNIKSDIGVFVYR